MFSYLRDRKKISENKEAEAMEQMELTRFQNLENPKYIEQQEQMALSGLHPHEESFFNQRLELLPNPRSPILIVGCGCGRLVYALAKKGYTVDGLDQSASLIRRARHLSQSFLLPVDFQCKSLEELNLSQTYGMIFVADSLINMIPSFKQRISFLEKAKDLLLPGGTLCLETDFMLLQGSNRFQLAQHFYPNKKALFNELRAVGFHDPQGDEEFYWAQA